MSVLKRLAGETAIYGIPSIVGRFLNWWLTPLYAWMFLPGEFGILSNVLAYVAFLQVLLTYGMETSYFRFASRSDNSDKVFQTAFSSLTVTAILFILFVVSFSKTLSGWVGYPEHSEFIVWMGITVAVDAMTTIPFARLRLQRKPMKFALFKIINIGVNILLNLFWILLCPKVLQANPDSFLQYFYSKDIGIGYAFLAYLISSVVTLLLFMPELKFRKMIIDRSVLIEMLRYGWPILIVGLAGMVNMNIDKILIPELIPSGDPVHELGIYSANSKLAILMSLFVQAFRFSFEPFLFSHYKNEDSKKAYAVIMNYFVVMGLMIFLGVMFYIDIIKFFIGSSTSGYHQGIKVVPWLLMGNLFLGMFYTQSLWYKLTDQTHFGARFTIIGAAITLAVNIIFVPMMGYMASAIAFFVASLVMTVISYFVGQKYFPVRYDLAKIAAYFAVAIVLFIVSEQIEVESRLILYGLKTSLFMIFIAVFWYFERTDLKDAFRRPQKG